MSEQNKSPLDDTVDKLVHGYDTMMENLHEWVEKSDEKTGTLLIHGIEDAEKFMHDLGDWSREEVNLLSSYVKRDLQHMAHKYESPAKKLTEWLQIDTAQVEQHLLDVLSLMADKTRMELDHLRHMADEAEELHTGEITSLGSIECKNCSKILHYHKAGRIPPCPSCHKTVFVRV